MFLQQLVNGLTLGSLYAVIAIGLTLVFGVLDIINMAHGGIFMIGAFVGLFMVVNFQMNIFVAIIVAMIVGALLGYLLEVFALRPLQKSITLGATYFYYRCIHLLRILGSPHLGATNTDLRWYPFRSTI